MGQGQGHCCLPLPALSKLPSHFFVSLCKTRIGPPYRAALSEKIYVTGSCSSWHVGTLSRFLKFGLKQSQNQFFKKKLEMQYIYVHPSELKKFHICLRKWQ